MTTAMTPRHQALLLDGERLRRSRAGGFKIPALELTAADADRLERFLIDNEMMNDVRGGIRMMLLATLVNPQWAGAAATRRSVMHNFRKGVWLRFMGKLTELQQEMTDELEVLAAEAEMEVVPDADQT